MSEDVDREQRAVVVRALVDLAGLSPSDDELAAIAENFDLAREMAASVHTAVTDPLQPMALVFDPRAGLR